MEVSNKTMAYTEVANILKYLEKEYKEKIPQEIVDYINENSLEYSMCFDSKGDFKLSELAKEILCYLNLEYWCTEKEKKELIEKYKNNEEKLSDIYNVNKIFEKKRKYNRKKEENTMIQIKENLFTKIIKKLKKILSK